MTTSNLLSGVQKSLEAHRHHLHRYKKRSSYYQQFWEDGRMLRSQFGKSYKRKKITGTAMTSFMKMKEPPAAASAAILDNDDERNAPPTQEDDTTSNSKPPAIPKHKNSPKKKKSKTPKKKEEFTLNPPLTEVQNLLSKNKKVSLDLITTECIKIEAEALPLPCSVYTLASALMHNKNVIFHHVHQSSLGEDSDDEEEEEEDNASGYSSSTSSKRLSNQFQKRLAITEESEASRDVLSKQKRETRLINALKQLECSVGSLDKRVNNWKEVRLVLEDVFSMPYLECDGEEEIQERLDAVHVDGKGGVVATNSSVSTSSSLWSSMSGSRHGSSSSHHGGRKHKSGKLSPKKKGSSKKKKKNRKLNDAVKHYCKLVTDAAIRRHLLPANNKWNQIESFKLPARLKPTEELEEEKKVEAKDEIPIKSTDDLLDARLNERIAKTEEIARSKSKKQSAHIDSLILKREEQEEALQKEEELRKQQEEEARTVAAKLLRPFTDQETTIVRSAIYGQGPGSEVLARCDADTVLRDSMRRLRPGQWLNDEVIHYFLLMLSKRDEQMCAAEPGRKRCHFFKSFFITKLFDEGNVTRGAEGTYNYNNVKRWSKRVPGKDIFKLDKIFFPINAGGVHWCCAVVYMTQKRIQFYDSLGGEGMFYLKGLFRYLKDEHMAKKGCGLPEEEKWELVGCTSDTPFQENGFDCGVFTCMYSDFLSKDCPLTFSQHHVTQCRERIALSIMNGSAIH